MTLQSFSALKLSDVNRNARRNKLKCYGNPKILTIKQVENFKRRI